VGTTVIDPAPGRPAWRSDVRIFGSVAATIDVLVTMEPGRPSSIHRAEQDLEQLPDGGRCRFDAGQSIPRRICRRRRAVKDDRIYLLHDRDAIDAISYTAAGRVPSWRTARPRMP
jgi:hypothetical protein